MSGNGTMHMYWLGTYQHRAKASRLVFSGIYIKHHFARLIVVVRKFNGIQSFFSSSICYYVIAKY